MLVGTDRGQNQGITIKQTRLGLRTKFSGAATADGESVLCDDNQRDQVGIG